ncbi:MAG: hypothetical protein AB1714_14190 [Acidobacteriota bacterium]
MSQLARGDASGQLPGTTCPAIGKSKVYAKGTSMKRVADTPTAATAAYKYNKTKPKPSPGALQTTTVCEGN